jgi:hypothetical protein
MVCAYGWGNLRRGMVPWRGRYPSFPPSPVIHHRHPSGLGLPFRVDLSLGSKMLDLVSRSIPGNVISFICKRSFPRLDLTMLFFKVSLSGTFRQSNLRYPLHSPGHGRQVCVISPFSLVARARYVRLLNIDPIH